jgi:hypothetical protein
MLGSVDFMAVVCYVLILREYPSMSVVNQQNPRITGCLYFVHPPIVFEIRNDPQFPKILYLWVLYSIHYRQYSVETTFFSA